MGLEPAGTNGWDQRFVVRLATSDAAASTAVITRGTERIELRPNADFTALPVHSSNSATVQAPLAYVGFGVSAPEFGHDDLLDIDLSGKVAVVIDDVPPALPPELRDYYGKEKSGRIAERGALGIVYIRMPETVIERRWKPAAARKNYGYALLDAEGQPLDVYAGLDPSILLDPSAVPTLFEGAPRTLDQIWADAEAGRVQSFDLPATISISTVTVHRSLPTLNVVGVLRGSGEDLSNEHVVLLAHLDHIGTAAPVDGDAIYNGALDNASGVAVMLEAARMLAAMEPPPQRSILFIATAGEEMGLLGSRHFALSPTVPRESLVAAINIDMPVALYPAGGFTAVGAEYSTLSDIAHRALRAEGMTPVPSRHPERGLFTYPDQYSFVREGIPALYIHDAPLSADPSIDAQAVFDEFLARHYHKVSDQIDLPIHWPTLASLARINARICLDIANADQRPMWLPDSFFGRQFSPGERSPR
jgi:hypothetical protein